MSRISYPFAAVPNHIVRGGHGAINLAVFTVLLSHGRCNASLKTIAKEVGCDIKSVRSSIKYWVTVAHLVGITIKHKEKLGDTNIYEIIIHEMRDTPTENGGGGRSETVEGGRSETVDKEEQLEEEQIKKKPSSNEEGGTASNKDQFVQTVIDSMQRILEIDQWADSEKNRRRYAYLIKTSRKWTIEQVQFLLKAAKEHPRHGQWCKTSDLYYKGVELIREAKRKSEKPTVGIIS